jgi:hypothetical protein
LPKKISQVNKALGGNMPNFKFIDFEYNLLKVDDYVDKKQKTIIIFPTQNNANMAQAYSQYQWQFEDRLYLAIEDFTDMLLPTDRVILEDDKRVIALYQLLTDGDKDFFKVTDFFDFIKLANKIFTLFDELAVELLDFAQVIGVLEEENSNIFPWQIEYYERIYEILKRYEKWLDDNKLDDKIFLKQVDKLNLDYFSEYENVYVVNQFYYTALEREIIKQLEESGKEVYLIYQIPEAFVDKNTFNAQPFNYSDLQAISKHEPDLKLIIDRNEFTMMNSLCKLVEEEEVKQVIDRDFYQSSYGKILSRKAFDISYSKDFINTEIYTFLGILQQLIEAIDYYNNQYFIPLHTLIRAFLNKTFLDYFAIKSPDNLIEEMYRISDRGVLYCDFQGKMGKEVVSEELKKSLKEIFKLLSKLSKIRSIGSLTDLIDQEEGIILDKLCSSRDLKYSNIKELIYTELANLQTYTYNKLITSWSKLSAKAEHIIIFKLFCDGLKAKTIKYTCLDNKKGIRINSLLDTRNNSYESLVFLNMIEGLLPSQRKSQFLFNEKQRQILNLKSYEEIRLREKYYFQRLVLTAKKSYFLAIESIDDDISTSSFLEELPLIKTSKDDRQADGGYREMFVNNEEDSLTTLDQEFWRLRLNVEELTSGNSAIKLSYTKLKTLMDNPLYYLIRTWAGVEEKEILEEPALDYRFIGIFAQDYVNHIVARIKDNFINQKVFYKFQFMSEERLTEIFNSFLATYSAKDYYIPHNYSYDFLDKILKTALVDGMAYFFKIVMHYRLSLSEKQIDLIPEEGFSPDKKRKYKPFITEDENDYKLGISVTGDADLRIENKEDESKYVIDFKTGSYSPDQLALYQYIYYWDDIDLGKEVKAGIYQILKRDWKAQTKDANQTISKLKDKVIQVLNEIACIGFSLPPAVSKAGSYSKITRADLALRR